MFFGVDERSGMATLSERKSASPIAGKQAEIAAVFIDFDGTICHSDVTDMLLQQFAPPEWEKVEADWLAGKIGARECLARQISLLKVTPARLRACLDSVTIDADFEPFIALLRQDFVPAAIVSDGLDYGIHHILRAHGLDNIAVFSNHLVYCGSGRWRLDFPYKNKTCPAGHCKCRRFDTVPKSGLTVYIGDGASDFCPVSKADIVFAKGKLADFCKKQRINHIEISNFADILKIWPDLFFIYSSQIKGGREQAAS
ncbi:MtnX-like HAD-IB family phosphatase [Candidatus Tokpelaia sp.]|uniref:MtnX-like HAD-IB family phosphatase n=1 Tax=Candidatus Tokpelaia sp. TaxID=2233777 RepID=UPI001FEDDEFF|nr:MtnX-like HAD-IB family phosphatase [Candidatus Tokpelaia sp.]